MKTFQIGGGLGDRIEWCFWDLWNEVVGWKTPKPSVGDLIESKMESGKIGVFELTEIKEFDDPKDMFFGKVKFVGYKEELEITK